MSSTVIPVPPFDLVIFGATGDLARRKILPALFHRFVVGQMPKDARVIGAARSEFDTDGFRGEVEKALGEFAEASPESVSEFLDRITYVRVDAKGDQGWDELAAQLRGEAEVIFGQKRDMQKIVSILG